jgi:hypothetical protein
MKNIAREVTLTAGLSASIAFLPAAAELVGLGSYEFLLLILGAASALCAVIAVLIAAFVREKRQWLRLAVGCGALALAAYPCMRLAWSARRLAFSRLATRSSKLVTAISSYESEHGAPPESLQSLVPRYLDRVPPTGLPAYPQYRYEIFPGDAPALLHWYDLGSRNGEPFVGLWKYADGRSANTILVVLTSRDRLVRKVEIDRAPKNLATQPFAPDDWKREVAVRLGMVTDALQTLRPEGRSVDDLISSLGEPDGHRVLLGATWELQVPCSTGFLNWDVFYYWPGGRYPRSSHGGSIERIGDWAYVHE